MNIDNLSSIGLITLAMPSKMLWDYPKGGDGRMKKIGFLLIGLVMISCAYQKPIVIESDIPYNASKEGGSCNISDGWRQNAFYIGNATAYVDLEDIELMYLLEHEGKPFTAAINVHYGPKQARCRHNHLVVIVGWLVDEDGDFYWQYKNSWGRHHIYLYPEYAECFNYVIVFDDIHKLDPCIIYDTNGTPGIQKDEAVNAIRDYLIHHTIEKKGSS